MTSFLVLIRLLEVSFAPSDQPPLFEGPDLELYKFSFGIALGRLFILVVFREKRFYC